jgi:glycosyltransferase involved in cell wall biosynthesis
MEAPWEEVARAGNWLLGLEADLRPDLIHLNGYAHGDLPWRAPTLMAGHSCVLSWWQAVHGEDAPPGWDRYRVEVRRGLRAANRVAAPTQALLDALKTHYGPFAASQVIPNGRDGSAFAPGAKQPFIFSAGRFWDEAKNISALAEAAIGLPWPVVVAGETVPPAPNSKGAGRIGAAFAPPSSHRGAKGEGAASSAPTGRSPLIPPELGAGEPHFLGPLPPLEIARRLSQAAIYALPARYEPFGLSALEAGLSGCALVLGDIPSLREVWGDAALFVPPDDPTALRDALCRFIGDAALREEMAHRAQSRAKVYTPERMAQGYWCAYQALLQENIVCD